MDIQRTIFIERTARFTMIACLHPTFGMLAINSLCKDTSTCSFTYTARSTEQIGMRQLPTLDCIFQRRGDMLLTYYRLKGCRTILSGTDNEILHDYAKITTFGVTAKRFLQNLTSRPPYDIQMSCHLVIIGRTMTTK